MNQIGDAPSFDILEGGEHIFGMNCVLKCLSLIARRGRNRCPECRKPIVDHWDKIDLSGARPLTRRRNQRAADVENLNLPVRVHWAAMVLAAFTSAVPPGHQPQQLLPPKQMLLWQN